MKNCIASILFFFLRPVLYLRYRIRVRGLNQLSPNKMPKPGGTLFLANHPAEIDPCILVTHIWKRFAVHPVVADFLFYIPGPRFFIKLIGSFPVPSFDKNANSFKRQRIEKTFEDVCRTLKRGGNVLLYPAGMLKRDAREVLGGASSLHEMLSRVPEMNIVLVRSTGLWGSSFSRAITGKSPDVLPVMRRGAKTLLRNFLFFTPRRDVTVEFEMVPQDFPWEGDKLTINRYLEQWYNARGTEPLTLVSYAFWKKELPEVYQPKAIEEVPLSKIPVEVQQKVKEEVGALTGVAMSAIEPQLHLSRDLGLDSLDLAALTLVLKEQFGVTKVNSIDLTTVQMVMAFAAKERESEEEDVPVVSQKTEWDTGPKRKEPLYPEAEHLLEAFFKTCDRMGKAVACSDPAVGEVTYDRLKLGVVLFAEYIRKLPGDRIGIMLPASVPVNILIFATQLAGKVPVMINWTLGKRNLDAVMEQTKLQVVLSSWRFLDRLANVDLGSLTDHIQTLEDIRGKFSFFAKMRAMLRCRQSGLLRLFGADGIKKEDTAVILFTSGTESFPKGVPLSHANVMANQKAAAERIELKKEDVLLGFLPPFHSFGFSVTGILPLIGGLRIVYCPNPTAGRQIVRMIEEKEVTIICSAPTFLKNMLRVGSPEQLKHLRLVITGAEKMPSAMVEHLKELSPAAEMLEGYGITECSPILTLNPLGSTHQGVGRPLNRIDLKIIHPETHASLPTNHAGLIVAKGPSIFQGYLFQSPSPFLNIDGERWYNTGDLGELNEEGFLTLRGRLKRFVKIGGEMVSLAAIEETLRDEGRARGWDFEPEVPSLAIDAVEVEGEKGQISLYTILDLDLQEVNTILKEQGMSNLIRVHQIKKVPYIPLLGSGKIDYRQLRER